MEKQMKFYKIVVFPWRISFLKDSSKLNLMKYASERGREGGKKNFLKI